MSYGKNIRINYKVLGVMSLIWSVILLIITILGFIYSPPENPLATLIMMLALEIFFIFGGVHYIRKQ